MNEVLNIIKSRKSIKKYKNELPDEKIIDLICEAGSYAPSGLNKQSPIILQITNKEIRDKISNLNRKIANMPEGFDPFYNAPVVLVVLANKDIPTYIYDGALVVQNMLLAAYSLGLGGCWIHRAKETFETKEGKEILSSLGIEGNYEGIANCIIGYPDVEVQSKPRKDNYIFKVK